jgi:hypothetical protein
MGWLACPQLFFQSLDVASLSLHREIEGSIVAVDLSFRRLTGMWGVMADLVEAGSSENVTSIVFHAQRVEQRAETARGFITDLLLGRDEFKSVFQQPMDEVCA